MSSQNLFLDQRMKGKESFPYAVPWRDSFAGWLSEMWLTICTVCRFSSWQGQTVRRVFWSSTLVGDIGMCTKYGSTKRADEQSVRQREKFPVEWASGGGLVKRVMAGFAKLVLLLSVGGFGTLAQADMAYIANSGGAIGNTVSVIDLDTNTVVDTITVGTEPQGVAVNPVLPRVYVANYDSHNVSVIDTTDNSVMTTVPIASAIPGVGSYPLSIAVNPAGTRVYVVNSAYVGPTTPNVVSVLDTGHNSVIATIPVGIKPTGVAVSPDGTRVYVSNQVSKNISVIEADTNSVIATVAVGTTPLHIAVSPDGTRLYVTSGYDVVNGQTVSNNTVNVIDTGSNLEIATVTLGLQPWGVVVNPAGTLVYVSNANGPSVSVIETATNTVVATLPMESVPLGMSFNADGTRLYVVNGGSDNVKVIDISTHTVIASVPVGDQPYSVGQFIRPAAATRTLTVTKTGNGQVSGEGTYAVGATVTLTATPDAGWTFTNWSPSPCANSFAMPNSDLTCTATFAQAQEELFAGTVIDQQGKPVAEATVKINEVEAQTDGDGNFKVSVARVERYVVNVTKSGYALISKIKNNPDGNANLRFTMKAAQVIQFDPAKPNTVKDSRGTIIELPADALIDSNGKLPPAGTMIDAGIYTYDLANEAMPGDMGAINKAGDPGYLISAGAFWVEFTDKDGTKYNLATGQSSQISVPAIKTDETTVDLWSYDEAKGIWNQEGSAKLVDGRFQGYVTHFSAWNFDWWKREESACVAFTIEQPFFDAHQVNGGVTILATAILNGFNNGQTMTHPLYTPLIVGTHVLYYIPPYSVVSFYVLPPAPNGDLVGTVNAGAPWGGTGYPNPPYKECAQITLDDKEIPRLEVGKVGTGTGTVTSNPTGINCDTDCTEDYALNTPVTLTAMADSGSTFVSWADCDSVNGNQCTVMMNADKAVTATFEKTQKYNLTVAKVGNGTVTSNPTGIDCGADCIEGYTLNTQVTLTATADSGSAFVNWSGCDSVNGNQCTVTMNADKAVTATFEKAQVRLKVGKVGNGTVTSNPTGINCGTDCIEAYALDTPVTLTATADSGSTFVSWADCDSVNSNQCTVTMNADKAVTATFTDDKIQLRTITASANGGGTISPMGSVVVSNGASQTFTVTPEACYAASVSVDGAEVALTNGQYTFTSVSADHAISVTFSAMACCQTVVIGDDPDIDIPSVNIFSITPDSNQGLEPYMGMTAWTWDGNPGVIRSLVNFNLSALPTSAQILSATLSLYHAPASNGVSTFSGSNQTIIQRIENNQPPWNPTTVTWNTQPTVTSQNQVIIPAIPNPNATWVPQDAPALDVTSLVQDMLAEGNYGVMMRLENENHYRAMQFASNRAPDQDTHPKLVITYSTCPCQTTITLRGPKAIQSVNLESKDPDDVLVPQPYVGAMAWTWSGQAGVVRSLINFDLSAIPAGADIVNATLSFYGASGTNGVSTLSGSNQTLLQRITSSWDPATVTWNTQPPATAVTALNQVVMPEIPNPSATMLSQDAPPLDVTNLVQDMIDNGNHSVMMSLENENHYRAMLFASSYAADPNTHPQLVITYQMNQECVIDLENNTHTCQSIPAISFVSQPENHQAVVKVSFDPMYGHRKALFEVAYNQVPDNFTVDICDSESCDGYGGDAGDTSNAAEVEVAWTSFKAYRNNLSAHTGPLLLVEKTPMAISAGTSIVLGIGDKHVDWNFPNENGLLDSPTPPDPTNPTKLFTLSGQATEYGSVDYDIYAAFNRVITGQLDRNGEGAKTVRIKLIGDCPVITATAGTGGTISPLGSVVVSNGASQTVTVTPYVCYVVDTVLVDGAPATLTNGQYTFTNVSADHAISVMFARIPDCLLPNLGEAIVLDPTDSPTTSKFSGGIAVNDPYPLQQVTLHLSDKVGVLGEIKVDPAHVGQSADIFVYAEATFPPSPETYYFMLGEGLNNILTWDENPANLAIFMPVKTLGSTQTVPMYQGTFFYPGTLKVYFGYRLLDGKVVTHGQAIDITILQ